MQSRKRVDKCYTLSERTLLAGLLLFSFLLPSITFSQDKIYRTDGTLIEAKVQEIGISEIKYKKFNNQNGPAYIIKKNDVRQIVYENGEKEVFNSLAPNSTPAIKSQPGWREYDVNGNNDLIIRSDGDSIRCVIDDVKMRTVSYHIRRRGVDPKATIDLDEVIKYSRGGQWFYSNGVSSSADYARSQIISGNINAAISAYSSLVSADSANATLLAEDAYALALGGVYDAALMRLDQSRSTGRRIPDINFFISQVFALMGYDDLAREFWEEGGKFKKPEWISPYYQELLNNFRINRVKPKISREKLIADFKLANRLAAQGYYLESVGVFHSVTDIYPGDYLPWFGYGIALEKAGAVKKAVQVTEKSYSLVADWQKRKMVEERLTTLRRKALAVRPGSLPGLTQKYELVQPQMMAYLGAMGAPNTLSINGRLGYFIAGSTNASFDFGMMNINGLSNYNFGLSAYGRTGNLVTGLGFQLIAGDKAPAYAVKFSVGVSRMNKKHTSSTDVFIDVSTGVVKGSVTTYGLSIGQSLYFGKRK